MRAAICIFLVLSNFALAADDFSPEMDPDEIDIVDVNDSGVVGGDVLCMSLFVKSEVYSSIPLGER
jgi:hypothetical protein